MKIKKVEPPSSVDLPGKFHDFMAPLIDGSFKIWTGS